MRAKRGIGDKGQGKEGKGKGGGVYSSDAFAVSEAKDSGSDAAYEEEGT